MSTLNEALLQASPEEIKQGYIFDPQAEAFICLICGERLEKGIIYQEDGVMYEAEKYMRRHIAASHTSMLDYLLSLDKKLTGLTDLQRTLVGYFAEGLNDQEIVEQLGGGSTSTIRNHRFTLREKMKQAKLFLAIMEMVEEQTGEQGKTGASARVVTKPEEQFHITEKEYAIILNIYFPGGLDGPLDRFPSREKRKYAVLMHLIQDFDADREYTEKEVNAVLETRFHDYVTLRRYLIEYRFMDRLEDGSRYWVMNKERFSRKGGKVMKDQQRRKQLVAEYEQTPKPMGVYRLHNKHNGKVLIGSSVNLTGAMNREEFQLNAGLHPNQALQQDWNEVGKGGFSFDILEELKPDEQAALDRQQMKKYRKELDRMEETWLEKVQPYGDQGYNRNKSRKK